MKKFILSVFLLLIIVLPVRAGSNTFTVEEVATHDTTDDCYMIFDESVYDITSYLDQHADRFMDINDWCGKDMTEDFMTKAGTGRDHKPFSYDLLEDFKLGELVQATPEITTTPEINNSQISSTDQTEIPTYSKTSEYNFYLLFLGTIVIYIIGWVLTKVKIENRPILNKRYFHLFWNVVLLITIIPSLVFGLVMIVEESIPFLSDISVRWLFWHVEGSIIFGTVALMHFLNRFSEFMMPLKVLFRKRESK